MKMLKLLTILLFIIPALYAQEFSTSAMRAITLREAYSLALKQSEVLAKQGEYIKQLDAAERAINSSFRPALGINGSMLKQQNNDTISKGAISGSYTIFSGMRDYISAKSAGVKTEAAKLSLDRARQQLYLDTADAYLTLLASQRDVVIRWGQMSVTAKRIKELQAREEIGRSRKSEVIAAQSLLAQDKANYLGSLASERLAQQSLMFLTGLATDLAPADIAIRQDAEIEPYLKTVLLRPDINSARKTVMAYGYQADAAEHNTWPEAAISANYFVLKDPMPNPVNRWDAAFTISMPVYTGGYAKAQRASALAAKRSAELDLELAQRQAISDVRAAYEDYKYSILQALSLEDALLLAEANAKSQQQDYKLGLVTNLDVLSALNTLQQTKLSLSQARLREAWTLLKLETAAGTEVTQ